MQGLLSGPNLYPAHVQDIDHHLKQVLREVRFGNDDDNKFDTFILSEGGFFDGGSTFTFAAR